MSPFADLFCFTNSFCLPMVHLGFSAFDTLLWDSWNRVSVYIFNSFIEDHSDKTLVIITENLYRVTYPAPPTWLANFVGDILLFWCIATIIDLFHSYMFRNTTLGIGRYGLNPQLPLWRITVTIYKKLLLHGFSMNISTGILIFPLHGF